MLIMIWAQDVNGVIGVNNNIPWHIAEDFQHFKKLTLGKTVIMGSNTWKSLPVRPLPKRENIVLTSQMEGIEGIKTINSIEDIIKLSKTQEIWVIGGASLYNNLLPYADYIYKTLVHTTIKHSEQDKVIQLSKELQELSNYTVHAVKHSKNENYKYSFITLAKDK